MSHPQSHGHQQRHIMPKEASDDKSNFTRELKLEAVRLLEQGDKNASVLARELGVPRNRLYKWREEIIKGARDDIYEYRAWPH